MRIQTLFVILLAAWLLYLILPFDLVPEAVAGPFGLIDDLLLLAAIYLRYGHKLREYREQLRFYRERLQGEKGDGEAAGSTFSEQRSAPHSFNPYKVLELERGADREQVERAYRKLMSLYHPDKVAHLGKELQELAHQKSLEIQSAYKALNS